jgi:hypothetical protein
MHGFWAEKMGERTALRIPQARSPLRRGVGYTGGQWGTMQRLTDDNENDDNPHLTTLPGGTVMLTWGKGEESWQPPKILRPATRLRSGKISIPRIWPTSKQPMIRTGPSLWYVYAVVDEDEKITEFDEVNNSPMVLKVKKQSSLCLRTLRG